MKGVHTVRAWLFLFALLQGMGEGRLGLERRSLHVACDKDSRAWLWVVAALQSMFP